jgi:hypothetical protein
MQASDATDDCVSLKKIKVSKGIFITYPLQMGSSTAIGMVLVGPLPSHLTLQLFCAHIGRRYTKDRATWEQTDYSINSMHHRHF